MDTKPQRSRNRYNPLFLGRFSDVSIRHLKGRLGAENKGQSAFRCTNDGTGQAFQNTWFELELTEPSFVILLKEPLRQIQGYDVTLTATGKESQSLGHPIWYDATYKYYRGMIAGSQSDLYNTIDEQSSYQDQNKTTLLPLQKGKYILSISTQRWDQINYSVYLIVETGYRSGYVLLEDKDNAEDRYLALETNTTSTPSFYLYEDADPNNKTNLRNFTVHNRRKWVEAWNQCKPGSPFPPLLTQYLEA